MKKLIIILAACFGLVQSPVASPCFDTLRTERNPVVNLYLDCDFCDLDYIRSEFTIVSYVSEPSAADVEVRITSCSTGSGGESYTMIMRGRERFGSFRDTLYFATSKEDTEDAVRETLLQKIELGLVPCILKTACADNLGLFITGSPLLLNEAVDDPWNSWSFTISGYGSYSGQKSGEELSLSGSGCIGKTTEKIKIRSDNEFGWYKSHMELYDGDSLLFRMKTNQTSFSSGNLVVWSLGRHCGLGGTASFYKSDQSNLDYRLSAGPAVEFNLFDYAEASRRELLFIYWAGFEHDNYSELTVNDRLKDNLLHHQFQIVFNRVDRWGSVYASAFAHNYLDNFSYYSLGAALRASIRLSDIRPLKGLAFYMMGSCSYNHDQVSLKKDMGDLGSMIKGLSELETGLAYHLSVGLSYSFGSVYNNVVNHRFER